MKSYSYYVLKDKPHKGTIIKWNSEFEGYKYKPKTHEWVESGIMLEYFWEDDPKYEMYEEITEEEAMKRIAEMK
ncbi:hypothetical protein CAL30_03420 [Megasphaera hutchinsoni]|uniref:Uncharacterized protein n=1 Tax=Megasphaera hutchinsoni TaxID=1588748 RepID=A0A2J8BB95_9FIRM|nr:hypothetical protein [Megasphaera genomosp. type_2]PNH22016.1 hypothetical protein CAL30_03420 [Megasphaera genomosp. type_2]